MSLGATLSYYSYVIQFLLLYSLVIVVLKHGFSERFILIAYFFVRPNTALTKKITIGNLKNIDELTSAKFEEVKDSYFQELRRISSAKYNQIYGTLFLKVLSISLALIATQIVYFGGITPVIFFSIDLEALYPKYINEFSTICILFSLFLYARIIWGKAKEILKLKFQYSKYITFMLYFFVMVHAFELVHKLIEFHPPLSFIGIFVAYYLGNILNYFVFPYIFSLVVILTIYFYFISAKIIDILQELFQ